jgi:glutathione peroxidase
MFKKIEVNGPNSHEVYKFLRVNAADLKDASSDDIKQIPWNFSKFLVNREGKVIGFYPPTIDPAGLESIIKQTIA